MNQAVADLIIQGLADEEATDFGFATIDIGLPKVLRISQTFIVIINVAHHKGITAALKRHSIFPVNIGFKHASSALYWVTA
jgi:hypothetical protein